MSENQIDERLMEEVSRPDDWPVNNRELRIERIYEAMIDFNNNPDYKNKEILSSLVSPSNLNEENNLGMSRFHEYEVQCINSIYIYASKMCFASVKGYLYQHLGQIVRNLVIISRFPMVNNEKDFEAQQYLIPCLKLFSTSYILHVEDRSRSFPDYILKNINSLISSGILPKEDIVHMLVSMMNDLSYVTRQNTFGLVNFTRDEVVELVGKIQELLSATNQSPLKRPLKGVLMTLISNWILKTRNETNSDYFYKLMSDEVALQAMKNHEIWMQKIEFLNDKREGKVIKEIFSKKTWLRYEWAKKIDIVQRNEVYVTSFSKSFPTKEMIEEYGKNGFGYKTDRITNVISPVYNHPRYGSVMDQTSFYDVTYSTEVFMNEINVLCGLIDSFEIDDQEKLGFLNEIIPYWIYSIKDKKWEHENERRYEIILHRNEYYDTEFDHRFMKIKSTVYLFPDFILDGNIAKKLIRSNRVEKLNAISSKEYYFCEDCFNSDFDGASLSHKEVNKCVNCGNPNIILVKVNQKLV